MPRDAEVERLVDAAVHVRELDLESVDRRALGHGRGVYTPATMSAWREKRVIREVSGDILLTKAELIAHGVAPADEHTVGLAAGMRETFPGYFEAFRDYCKALHPMPGDGWTWGGAGKKIVCLFTQQQALTKGAKPGPASIEAVDHAMVNLKKAIKKTKAKSVALTKLATGAGGLSWEQVKPVILRHLEEIETPVILYSDYQRGVPAAE
jgi:O-acetyl-ADP-ribose deacetylase (regulator of RNase III)